MFGCSTDQTVHCSNCDSGSSSTLVNTLFQMLSCRTLSADGAEVANRHDYSIDCNANFPYELATYLFFCLYAVGIPVAFLVILRTNRADLSRTEEEDTPQSHATKGALSFLVSSYRPRYYYYEIIEYVRKLILTGVLTVVAQPGSAIQAGFGLVVSFFSFALASSCAPFVKGGTLGS